MLLIIMHNRRDYLEALASLARQQGIEDTAIIEDENVGIRLVGGTASFMYYKGTLTEAYDKALIAVVRGEENARRFLDSVENEPSLELLNLEDRGFICVVPFQKVRQLSLEKAPELKETRGIRIADYLRSHRILLSLKACKKRESIEEIAAVLKDAEEVTDYKRFLDDIFEREKLTTTGIGHGIAIPHARTQAVNDFVIAFARSKEGVEFDSLDGEPVNLIFLMGTPATKGVDQYLKILAHLTRLLRRREFREALLSASTPDEIMAVFAHAEENR